MPFAVLPVLQWLGSGFWAFSSSRMGQIIIAATVAWLWSGWRADDHWRAIIAAEKAAAEAAYRAEIARQEQAAVEIAAAATARAEEDETVARELRAQIEAFNAEENRVEHQVPPEKHQVSVTAHQVSGRTPVACSIDGGFADVVRRLDEAAHRQAKPSRPAR